MLLVAKSRQTTNNTEALNDYIAKLDHPFKAEVQTV
jgi:hypothetical protein